MRPMRPASATSSRTMRRREPPMARLMPISRVRSATRHRHGVDDREAADDEADDATPMMIALKIAVADPDLLVELGAGQGVHVVDRVLDLRPPASTRSTPSSG